LRFDICASTLALKTVALRIIFGNRKKKQQVSVMSKHTLYYSTRCRFSQAFLEELATTPFTSQFNFVNVDPSPKRPPLPAWLKSVPSLMVVGESTPRVGPGPVNNWLFERKMGGTPTASAPVKNTLEDRSLALPVYSPDIASRPSASSRGETGRGTAPMSASDVGPMASSGGAGAEGPDAYHSAEMASGKWSDAYSFLGDPFSAEKGYDPIQRNFQSLLGPGPVVGGGAGGGAAAATAEKRSPKEDALLKDFEAYSKARDRDVTGPPKRQ